MNIHKIVINGQPYDGPDAMPPDVRRIYDEAMRAAGPPSASRENGGTTQVFTGRAGTLDGSLVVSRVVTVNELTHASVDQLPPDVRKLYQDALEGATPPGVSSRPKGSLHLSVSLSRSADQSSGGPAAHPDPFDSTSTESKLRGIPVTLAIIVVIGLILWIRLGR